MGLGTIDPHGRKEHTEIHKIPKFSVNQASFDGDTAKLIGKEMYGIRTLMVIHFFVNFDIFNWLYLAYY